MPKVRIRLFTEVDTKIIPDDTLDFQMKEVIRDFYRLVKEEFEGSFWRSPSGAKIKWEPRRGGGKHRLLIKTGELLRASTGQSSKGRSSHTKKSFSIYIDVDYAYLHRGGTSLSPTGDLGITPRRFATDNPEIREIFKERVRKGLLGVKNNS